MHMGMYVKYMSKHIYMRIIYIYTCGLCKACYDDPFYVKLTYRVWGF